MILYIIKRNGEKVLFNKEKIAYAIQKAFIAVQNTTDQTIIDDLAIQVEESLNSKYQGTSSPSVEHTQDIVENILMRNGHMEIAKAYILYREQHKQIREQIKLNQIKDEKLNVITTSGELVPFKSEWIAQQIERISFNLPKIDTALIVDEICKNVYNNMPLEEVETLILNTAKQKIEQHYDYSFLSARLVSDRLYKQILSVGLSSDALKKLHEDKFKTYIDRGIELELLSPELAEFDLAKIAEAIDPSRDLLLQYLGLQTLEDRYLLRERDGKRLPFELPQWMWMRVSMGLALKEEKREEKAILFYNHLSQLLVVSSTPTLFNSGTTHSQMSSCYLNTVEDSMEGIFKNFADNAQLSKWAGGIGTNWSAVRSKNAMIKGTNGTSQGIIPFIKIYNDVALAVNQGGKRKGAMAAYLDIWHSDIEEFLELKKNTGDERRRAHDIHTAVFISDLFMKRVKQRGSWTLFSPNTVPELLDAYGKNFEEIYARYEQQEVPGAKKIEAIVLWRKLLTMLYETGHPWITYRDSINVRSPQDHVGVVRNSNLCTEITLNTSKDETAVCNLASINMGKMIKDKALNEDLIRQTVSVAMRMLDNVVDNNFYPTKEAEYSNMKHRPVGLGMMGYQDALYQMEIDFDSQENVEFADESMELISHASILASTGLAKERGAYETFKGSKWDRGLLPIDTVDLLEKERGMPINVSRASKQDWDMVRKAIQENGMRNSNCMAIAPTATISNIAGTVPCVEPTFKNIYMKENLSGNFTVVNKYLIDALDSEGLLNEKILTKIKINNGSVLGIDEIPSPIRHRFKETFEIEPSWILKAAARRTKWIDQSASTNIFLKTTSGRVLSETYMNAWEMGLKTTYYLRTLAASQVTKTADVIESENTAPAPSGKPAAEKVAVPAQEFKACSIDDPDCEACQ